MRRALRGLFWLPVALLTAYTIQAAVLFHWALKLRLPPPPPGDGRSPREVRAALEKAGRPAALHFSPAFLVGRGWEGVFPLGGQSNRTVVHCNEYGEWLTYPSDEHGFNNRRGAHRPGRAAAVIGDSFAEGSCVRPGEDIPARLGALNLGIGGAGPLIELAILKEYAAPLKPKRLYWLYYPSDMPDLRAEEKDPRLARYAVQGLKTRQAEADAAWRRFEAVAEAGGWQPAAGGGETLSPARRAGRFLAFYYLRAWAAGGYPLSAGDRALLERYVAVLEEARRLTEAWGGRFTWVYLPERVTYVVPARADRFRRELLERLRARGFEVVEVRLDLDAFWLRRSTHYTAEGYRRAAEAIQAEAPVEARAKRASTTRQEPGAATAD